VGNPKWPDCVSWGLGVVAIAAAGALAHHHGWWVKGLFVLGGLLIVGGFADWVGRRSMRRLRRSKTPTTEVVSPPPLEQPLFRSHDQATLISEGLQTFGEPQPLTVAAAYNQSRLHVINPKIFFPGAPIPIKSSLTDGQLAAKASALIQRLQRFERENRQPDQPRLRANPSHEAMQARYERGAAASLEYYEKLQRIYGQTDLAASLDEVYDDLAARGCVEPHHPGSGYFERADISRYVRRLTEGLTRLRGL
jgi:hypothetical protein